MAQRNNANASQIMTCSSMPVVPRRAAIVRMHVSSEGLFVDRAASDSLGLCELRLRERRSCNHYTPVDAGIGRAVADGVVEPLEGHGAGSLVHDRLDFAGRDQAVDVNRDLPNLGSALGERLATLCIFVVVF